MDWTLTDLHDDVQERESQDRWLLLYETPPELGATGYSVSYPKSMVTGFAATYGYDLDDPADVDIMFDHLFHLPFVREVALAENRAHEVKVNPYQVSAETARAVADAQVEEFKRSHRIVPAARQRMLGAGVAPAVAAKDLLDVVKADMLARADRRQVAEIADTLGPVRERAQADMLSQASRMNSAFNSRQEHA
jgi:hypothetical protein